MGNFKKANSNGKGLSHPAVRVLIALNIILIGIGWYIYRQQGKPNDQFTFLEQETTSPEDSTEQTAAVVAHQRTSAELPGGKKSKQADNLTSSSSSKKSTSKSLPLRETATPSILVQAKNNHSTTRYTVAKGLAHFHNRPDPSTKRKAFINHWNKAVLKPLDEQNGFIYIVYTNHLGQTSKGWMALKDLEPIPDK